MGERVLDHLKHLPVELGLAAGHVELDLLVEFERQFAHQPRQLLPGIGDRLHAGLHDALLQLGGNGGEALKGRLELALAGAAHEIEQLIAGEHQFAHRGHQMLERVDADAHALGARLRLPRAELGCARRRSQAFCRLDGIGPGRCAPRALELIERGMDRGFGPPSAASMAEHRTAPSAAPSSRASICSRPIRSASDPGGSAPSRSSPVENLLDAVDAGEDDADALDRDGSAVAILAHQGLGRMGELGEAVQAEKAASPFDGMDQPEDGVEHLGIVRLLLEAHELNVELIEPLAGFGQKFTQELVHGPTQARANKARAAAPRLCRRLSELWFTFR